MTIDGADQVAPDGWLVKGGGAAHTREKIVAAAADRFVVIADSTKVVDALHAPIPVELLEFGLAATMARLAPTALRDVAAESRRRRHRRLHGARRRSGPAGRSLSATPGLVEHGLFPPEMVAVVLIGRGDAVERRDLR